MLAQACYLAGLLNEALVANETALAAIAEHQGMDADVTLGLSVSQILGFDVEHWIKCSRTRILVQLGRFDEAREWLDAVFRAAPGRVDPAVIQFIPHFAAVEMAWWQDDPEAAQRHAAQVGEYAAQTAIPYLRVAARNCFGLAQSAAGDFPSAVVELQEGLALARRAKAGLEFEARLVSDLADTLYRAGEIGRAAEMADEAIDIARRRTHRVAECHALLTCAAALLTAGRSRGMAAQLLERAEQLVQLCGAAVFRSNLAHVRLQLQV
jgi:adenylate cyclase